MDQLERFIQCRQIMDIIRSCGQGEVAVPVEALACSRFIGVTAKGGIFLVRVGVDGDSQHITAFIENILRAVPSVIVDIQNGDFPFCG